MTKTIKVLFVCSDNYTRSITAQFCLRNYLLKYNITNIKSFSAGTRADSDTSKYYNDHFERMRELGIDFSTFKRTPFNKSFFEIYDIIIGMGLDHKDYMLREYGQVIPIFNEIYKGEANSVLVTNPRSNESIQIQIKEMVDYINNAMPQFVKNIRKYLL